MARHQLALARYHHCETSSALFQIGIVLASAVITGAAVLSYAAGALGLIGIGFGGLGFLAPHAVHLF